MIAHSFDIFVMSLNTIIQFLHELLMFVAIVNRSAKQTNDISFSINATYVLIQSQNRRDFYINNT